MYLVSCNLGMTEIEDSYQTLLRRLGKTEGDRLDERVREQESVEIQVIEKNVQSDKEHLTIVNFCINRFSPGSRINVETGFVWVRAEPLYRLGIKNFDIAVFNYRTATLILVECKSGLSDANREVKEIEEKIQLAIVNKTLLSEVVGEKIGFVEFALCVKAGLVPAAKGAILSKKAAICLWSADIFGSIIFLDKLGENSNAEISAGRLHRDEKLRKLLLDSVKEDGSSRIVTFLPSSHMCSILEEIVPQLRLEFNNTNNQSEEFGLNLMHTLIKREISLHNFEDQERYELAKKAVVSGIRAGIFVDMSKDQTDLRLKKLKLASQTQSARQLAKDCHMKYVQYKARENTLKRILAENANKQPSLDKY